LTQKKQKVKAPIGFLTLRELEKPTTCKLAGCFSPAQTAESRNILPRSDIVVAQTVQVAYGFCCAHSTKADMAGNQAKISRILGYAFLVLLRLGQKNKILGAKTESQGFNLLRI
jgi:hypothetical protein